MEHPQITESTGYYQNGIVSNKFLNLGAPTQFPVDTLPSGVRPLIEEAHEVQNLDKAYTGSASLAALSTAIGNSREIHLKRQMTQPGVLYMGIIGKPSTGKSPAQNLMFGRLMENDNRSWDIYQTQEKEYDKWHRDNKKGEAVGEEPEEPMLKQQLIDDHTPEVLADILTNNPRGACLYVDELSSWFESFGRYNSGPDVERYLSMWSCNGFKVDRRSKRPIRVPRPFCSVFGGIQPGILGNLFSDKFANNGLTDRILFANLSPDRVPDEWDDKDIDEGAIVDYHNLLDKLNSLQPEEGDRGQILPRKIKFSEEALQHWKPFYNDIQKRIHKDSGTESGMLGKLEQYVPRLALILALGRDTGTWEVTGNDLEAAIRLGQYFEGQHREARQLAGADSINLNKGQLVSYLNSQWNVKPAKIAEALNVSAQYVNNILNNNR